MRSRPTCCRSSIRCEAAGVTDLRGLAGALNDRGVRTARGGRWHVSNVRNLLRRSAAFS